MKIGYKNNMLEGYKKCRGRDLNLRLSVINNYSNAEII
jgi:hypothetical protein